MIDLWWYYGISAVMIGIIAVLVWKLEAERQLRAAFADALKIAREKRDAWKAAAQQSDAKAAHAYQRLQDTEAGSSDLVTLLLPLLEQTDWMTGRWAGQYDTLVRLEKERNAHVVALRQAVSRLPAVVEMDPFEVLKGASSDAWQRLQTETGVPEGQGLLFGREGGVERVSRPTEEAELPPYIGGGNPDAGPGRIVR